MPTGKNHVLEDGFVPVTYGDARVVVADGEQDALRRSPNGPYNRNSPRHDRKTRNQRILASNSRALNDLPPRRQQGFSGGWGPLR